MSRNRLKNIPRYKFGFQYEDELIEINGVERVGIWADGSFSFVSVDGEFVVKTGWSRLTIIPEEPQPYYPRGLRLMEEKEE